MKLFFFDIETTGVMHWRNGIHQISGLIEINGEIKERFDYKVRPNPKCTIDEEALKVGGVTLELINSYPEMLTVYNKLITMLSKYVDKYNRQDKFFLVGYNNASFDNNFLRAFFVQCFDEYFGSWFWSSAIDVMVLAADNLIESRHKMKDFKLKTVAQQFGIAIEEDRLHEANYDIELTRKIFKIIHK